jgi:hypothetical protein
VDAPAADLDEEKYVEAAQRDRLDGEEVAGEQARGLAASLRVFLCIGGWLGVVGDAVSEVDA